MKMHTWPVPYVAFVHGKDEMVEKGIEAHFHRILARLEMQICAWVDAQEMRRWVAKCREPADKANGFQ